MEVMEAERELEKLESDVPEKEWEARASRVFGCGAIAEEEPEEGSMEPEQALTDGEEADADARETADAWAPVREEGETAPAGNAACAGPDLPPDVRDLPAASEITTKELGERGEDAATRYLEYKGYTIMERNWVCKFGEADIVAADPDGVICFIEVKTRRSVEAGLPEEAITPEKQRKYEKIALCYMIDADWDDGVDIRFDAIGICVTEDHRAMLRYHRGCFDVLH